MNYSDTPGCQNRVNRFLEALDVKPSAVSDYAKEQLLKILENYTDDYLDNLFKMDYDAATEALQTYAVDLVECCTKLQMSGPKPFSNRKALENKIESVMNKIQRTLDNPRHPASFCISYESMSYFVERSKQSKSQTQNKHSKSRFKIWLFSFLCGSHEDL